MEINSENFNRARRVIGHNLPKASVAIGCSVSTLIKLESHGELPKSDAIKENIRRYIDKHIKKDVV